MHELKLPKTGQSMEEGLVAEWAVDEGEAVEEEDVVVLFESEKATSEIRAEQDGNLLRKSVQEGDTVPIGTTLGYIGTEDERDQINDAADADTDADSVKTGEEESLTADSGDGIIRATPKARKLAREQGTSIEDVAAEAGVNRVTPAEVRAYDGDASTAGVQASSTGDGDTVLASPLARKTASEEGINLAEVHDAVGADRLRVTDVEEYLETTAEPATQATEPEIEEGGRTIAEEVPIQGTRKVMFDRMQQVASEYGSTTTIARVDVTELLDLYDQLGDAWGEDTDLSLTAFVLRAVAQNLSDYPELNAEVDKESLTIYEDVNLGLAVNTDSGLLVPTIEDADNMSVRDLSAAISAVAGKARNDELSYEEMQNGTFTVSNAGGMGAYINTPQINPPQTGILGMCTVFEDAAVVDGEVEPRKLMHLCLTYDHRVVEGATAVHFLQAVKDALEEPASLLS